MYLRLLTELMTAFAAGDRYFANLTRQTHTGFALGAAEITELFDVLRSNNELTCIGFEVLTERKIFMILCNAFCSVAGKDAENTIDIGSQAKIIENHQSGDVGEQGQHDACKKDRP